MNAPRLRLEFSFFAIRQSQLPNDISPFSLNPGFRFFFFQFSTLYLDAFARREKYTQLRFCEGAKLPSHDR